MSFNSLERADDTISYHKIEIASLELDVQKGIKSILTSTLSTQKPALFFPVYTIIFEVITNSMKAVAKRIFFLENNLNIDNPEDYSIGIKKFQNDIINQNEINECYKKGKKYSLGTVVEFYIYRNGLKIEVSANIRLLSDEERRIRKVLKECMNHSSLDSFYENGIEKTEGEGLGLALIVSTMKSYGIDPSYHFRIGLKRDYSITRIEIPLSNTYVSEREHFDMEKKGGFSNKTNL